MHAVAGCIKLKEFKSGQAMAAAALAQELAGYFRLLARTLTKGVGRFDQAQTSALTKAEKLDEQFAMLSDVGICQEFVDPTGIISPVACQM